MVGGGTNEFSIFVADHKAAFSPCRQSRAVQCSPEIGADCAEEEEEEQCVDREAVQLNDL